MLAKYEEKLGKYECNRSELHTVEPLLSGHPQGMARWPLNRGMPNIDKNTLSEMFLLCTFKSLFITKVKSRSNFVVCPPKMRSPHPNEMSDDFELVGHVPKLKTSDKHWKNSK